jgi:hypothetical protein
LTDKIRLRDWEENFPVTFYSHLEQMRGNPAEADNRLMTSSGFHTQRVPRPFRPGSIPGVRNVRGVPLEGARTAFPVGNPSRLDDPHATVTRALDRAIRYEDDTARHPLNFSRKGAKP